MRNSVKLMKALSIALFISTGLHANAATKNVVSGDYLVKFKPGAQASMMRVLSTQAKVNDLGFANWAHVKVAKSHLRTLNITALQNMSGIEYVQPNYKIRLLDMPGMNEVKAKLAQMRTDDDCPIPGMCGGDGGGGMPGMPGGAAPDNPEIPGIANPGTGADPQFNSQWGMLDIGVQKAWNKSKGRNNVVVAVIDTGVDYTHEDLVENLWRNSGEMGTDDQGRDKSKNGVDDDNNGYVDDLIGWDFVSNDNKPFDFAVSSFEVIFPGGNPGHGTHCAGNVAARGFNGKGVSGVAPNVSIMSIRFLSEKGEGSTAGAVQSLAYALKNGAHITSNSWGSDGEDPNDPDNKALHEIIQASQAKGVLFIAAAGNGRNGAGYDNDGDSKPGMPASAPYDIIVSVAALDVNNALGAFSNWGRRTVDIGAPGVKVFSTVVGNGYSDTVVDLFGMKVTWDGTSMATPHVAGAAALYLSHNPNASWSQIKSALLNSATKIPSLSGKVVSEGKLNVESLLNQ